MNQLSIAPTDNPPMDYTTEEREITLGTGKVLALFFALVILCATFFGMGYSMGRNSTKQAAEPPAAPAASLDSSTPPASANPSPAGQSPAAANPADQEPSSSDRSPAAAAPAARNGQSASPGGNGSAPAGTTAKPGPTYFVQVAAVTKQEDAQALVESLKGRQYQAFIADSSDQLFHVQLGPFPNLKEAEAMRARLMNDGYNPILKK